MFIDTHAHLDFPQYHNDREGVVRRSREEGVDYIINVGTTICGCRHSLELAGRYDFLYTSIGIHPHHASEIDEESLKELEKLASSPKVVAIGETGLDYYKNFSPPEIQKEIFRHSIRLARKLHLPLIIHSRSSAEDTIKILKEESDKYMCGVVHCYSYSWEIAEIFLDMGFYISVTGSVTFTKSTNLREVVRKIPLKRLLLETDCPFLAPQIFRGRRNEPGYIKYLAEELGHIYDVSIEEIGNITSLNAKELFKLR